MTTVTSVRVATGTIRVIPVVAGPPGAHMTWQGAWSSASTYAVLDAVSNAGSAYICTAAVGPSATTPDVDTAHWSVLAQAGTDGAGTMNGPASAVDGHMAVFNGTTGALVKDGGAPLALGTTSTTALAGNTAIVPPARKVSTGAGLLGGGDLTADRTLTPDFGTAAGKVAQGNDSRFVGVPVTTQTAAYTLVAPDAGSIVEVNSASAVTVTVPASIFAAGQIVEICQIGAGQVTIAAGSGVTLDNANGLKTAKQYSSASIRFRSTTEAVISGDTAV